MKIIFIEKNHYGQIQEIGKEYNAELLGITYYLREKFLQVCVEGDVPRCVGFKSIKAQFTESEMIEFPSLIDCPSVGEYERAKDIINRYESRKKYENLNQMIKDKNTLKNKVGEYCVA